MADTFNQSPYNFVPISEKVVFPDWADFVTQDIPFSDGLSGTIEIKLTAETPIFVNDKKPGKNESASFFKMPDGTYCIPGSSVKGAIRNVLEIMTFSKMLHVSERRYGIRDLNLTKYRDNFTQNLVPVVKAGWLEISEEKEWQLYPCKFALIDRKNIPGKNGEDFVTEKCSSFEKYDHFGKDLSISDFEVRRHDEIVKGGLKFMEVRSDPVSGMLVFTGQPTEPGTDRAKHNEFVFYDTESNPISVSVEVKKDFEFIYGAQKIANDAIKFDWDQWKERCKAGQYPCDQANFGCRIPVFYLADDYGKITSIGLSMLYRLPGKVSIHESIGNVSKEHLSDKPDLSDLIFGFAGKDDALRGRVHFSHFTTDCANKDATQKLYLASPKPTFYPSYLQQPERLMESKDYQTFLDPNAKARGWKRYPVLNKLYETIHQNNNNSDKSRSSSLVTDFTPITRGTEFRGVIHYHNLLPIELGALLCALTWELEGDITWRHSIGMAKPFGFGVVKLQITNKAKPELRPYIDKFIGYMDLQLQEKWKITPSIKALFDMAAFGNIRTDWNFAYLPLKERDKEKPSYIDVKRNKQVLGTYSIKKIEQTIKKVVRADEKEENPFDKRIQELQSVCDNPKKLYDRLKKILDKLATVNIKVSQSAFDNLESRIRKTNWYKNKMGYDSNRDKILKLLETLKGYVE